MGVRLAQVRKKAGVTADMTAEEVEAALKHAKADTEAEAEAERLQKERAAEEVCLLKLFCQLVGSKTRDTGHDAERLGDDKAAAEVASRYPLPFPLLSVSHIFHGIEGARHREEKRLQRQNALQAGACLGLLYCEQYGRAPQFVHAGPDEMPEQWKGKVALLRDLIGIEVLHDQLQRRLKRESQALDKQQLKQQLRQQMKDQQKQERQRTARATAEALTKAAKASKATKASKGKVQLTVCCLAAMLEHLPMLGM